MATVNLSMLPSGAPAPGPAGQIASGPGDAQEPAFVGSFTVTNTGTATDIVNWIDGTLTLPFTPTGVVVFRTGGTAAATISVASASAITATSVTLNYSATPVASTTVTGIIAAYK